MKNTIIGALIIGLIVGGAVFMGANKINTNFGGASGQTHDNLEYFLGGGITEGGMITLSGVATSSTLTAKQFCENKYISFSSSVASSSTTLPTAASLIADCFQQDGDTKTVIFYNRGDAASTTVFIAGTGDVLYFPEVTGANGVIAGLNTAIITLTRASSTGMLISIREQVKQ
jgi:hypothetical protein